MWESDEEIEARLLAIFRTEAEEHLQRITTNLLVLERAVPDMVDRDMVEATFREVHTLKGAARSVSLTDIEGLCQSCESALSRVVKNGVSLTLTIIDAIQAALDAVYRLLSNEALTAEALAELVVAVERSPDGPLETREEASGIPSESVESPAISAPRTLAPPGSSTQPADTVRLATAKLDDLLVQVEDLLALKLAAQEREQEARAISQSIEGALSHFRGAATATAAGPEVADGIVLLRAIEKQIHDLVTHLAHDWRVTVGTVDSLQDESRRLRMMPASGVLDLFPRMVRDLARELNKEVVCDVVGAELDIDRQILETMKDPLIHLVRNAVGHGIESGQERTQAGKPREGRVTVAFSQIDGSRMQVEVTDDGRGIDLQQVRAVAVRGHLMGEEEAANATDRDVLDLIYRSGLSTSPIITDVSGHGLGMSIVREHVERLKGTIHVETRPSMGTTVRMVMPAAIATFRGLLVQAAGEPFLFPLESVERAIHVVPSDVETVDGRSAVSFNGRPLVVSPLSAALGISESSRDWDRAGDPRPCVVVRSDESLMGLLVDELVGDREALVKELRPPLVQVRNVAAVGLLGTGEVVPILRPSELLRSATTRAAHAPSTTSPGASPTRSILVVDDSITTRMMERNLLEAAGYQVDVAVDGLDALTHLRTSKFDLVVSDVDMPRMDGFRLTERIRADAALAELPVVLVTAMDRREDKERGVEVGASAYLIKSSFDQSNLLEIIRRLV